MHGIAPRAARTTTAQRPGALPHLTSCTTTWPAVPAAHPSGTIRHSALGALGLEP